MSNLFNKDEQPSNADYQRDISFAKTLKWKYSAPFVRLWKISAEHIDHYQHTNNVAYLSRLEKLAWEHSQSLGLQFDDYQRLDRAMVITQHHLRYHAPSHLEDKLACATWIIKCDKKFRLSRCFEFIRLSDEKSVFSAQTDFVCCSLSTGMPKKMPEPFLAIYGPALIDGASDE